jgi:hypothetical protein
VIRFTLLILIPQIAAHLSSSIILGWYNRSNSDRRTKLTQSHPPQEAKEKLASEKQSLDKKNNILIMPEVTERTANLSLI